MVELGTERVTLRGSDQVGLGVEFDKVRHVPVIRAVPGDQPELRRKDPDPRPARNPEEVLGVGVFGMDALAGKVIVKVLDLLVPGKEHQPPGAVGDRLIILPVSFLLFWGHIEGDPDIGCRWHTPSSQSPHT
ncbi:hypothetical protein DSECCO2_635810 [anaerobic digester metagenome]